MKNQKKEELRDRFFSAKIKDYNKIFDFFVMEFDNIINEKIEKIESMLPTEEEIEKQKECGEYNCYSKQRDYFTLETVITILKE